MLHQTGIRNDDTNAIHHSVVYIKQKSYTIQYHQMITHIIHTKLGEPRNHTKEVLHTEKPNR